MLTCYAEPQKRKSQIVLEAFAQGSGAHLAGTVEPKLLPGAAVFYGVRRHFEHLWRQALAEKRDFYFVDNAYFDSTREMYFRVTKNAIQHTGLGASSGERFAQLRIEIKPERERGNKVIICTQSEEFMDVIANDVGWLSRTKAFFVMQYGEENVIVRAKNEQRPLAEDLKDAQLLVTWSSAAAITALLEGVRAVTSPRSCVAGLGVNVDGDDRHRWASVLADNQWTLAEMRAGMFKSALGLD